MTIPSKRLLNFGCLHRFSISKSSNNAFPALYMSLLTMLTSPPTFCGDKRRIPAPASIAKRIASRRFKQWQKMMGLDRPNLLSFLPRLMLLDRTQRACSIPSLAEMTLTHHVAFYPRNIKLLRAMFSECFNSGKSFALEFNSIDNRILVLRFIRRNGAIFLATELYDRFSGIIRKTEELEVNLDHDRYLINLSIQITEYKSGLATFFYAHGVFLPFQMDYDTGDFSIFRYSLVSFWLDDEKQKRIRECEPFTDSPSEPCSKRHRE
jgi:hypothetical protein